VQIKGVCKMDFSADIAVLFLDFLAFLVLLSFRIKRIKQNRLKIILHAVANFEGVSGNKILAKKKSFL